MEDSKNTRRYDITQQQALVDEAKDKFKAEYNERNLSLIIRILLKKYVSGKTKITMLEVVENSRRYKSTYERILAQANEKR